MTRYGLATGYFPQVAARLAATFFRLCELVHKCPRKSRASCSSPDGVSRFQYPGLARSLTVYCVDGLVLFLPNFWAVEMRAQPANISQAGDLRSRRFAS